MNAKTLEALRLSRLHWYSIWAALVALKKIRCFLYNRRIAFDTHANVTSFCVGFTIKLRVPLWARFIDAFNKNDYPGMIAAARVLYENLERRYQEGLAVQYNYNFALKMIIRASAIGSETITRGFLGLPILNDKQCRELAKTTRYSFDKIRGSFPDKQITTPVFKPTKTDARIVKDSAV